MINIEPRNCLDLDAFLLALEYQRKKSKCVDGLKYSLPDTWQRILGDKLVVCFYLGRRSFLEADMHDDSYLISKLDFLRKCFSHLHDVILWWFDDGLLLRMIKDRGLKMEQKIMEGYKPEIMAFQQCGHIIHDTSENWERVLAWSDAYYGDESTLAEEFRKSGKLVSLFDITRLSDGRPSYDLVSWIENILHKPSETGKLFTKQAHHQGKRVVLAYASSTAALSQGETFFYRWSGFLTACMEQNLAVWWLCDSSMPEVVECMALDAREKFLDLKYQAESCQDALWDVTGCLESALDYCDAYYGNYAEAAVRRAVQCMPVVWNNYGQDGTRECHMGTDKGMLMSFISGCWVGDEYYFTHWRANGLFKVRSGSNYAEFVTKLPFDSKERKFLSAAVFYTDGKLYFIPTNITEILVLDLTAVEWYHYRLDSQYGKKPYVWFVGAFKIGSSLWLQTVNYAAMVRFDLDTHTISYFSGWGKKVWDSDPDAYNQYWGEATLVGEDIWMAAKQSGYIMKFSTVSQKAEMYEVHEAASGLRSMAYDGTDFWLYTLSDTLLRWNPQRGVIGGWEKPLGEGKGGAVICKAGKAWLFAHFEDVYVKIDTQSEIFSRRDHYLHEDLRSGLGYAQLTQDNEKIYINPNAGELIVCLNPETENVETYNLRMVEADDEKYAMANFQGIKEPVGEGQFYDTYELVMYLRLGCKSHEMIENKIIEKTGQAIYEKIVYSCQ